MYRIVLTQRALRDPENIEKRTQDRIATKLKEYAHEPLKYAWKLINQEIGTYRFRIISVTHSHHDHCFSQIKRLVPLITIGSNFTTI